MKIYIVINHALHHDSSYWEIIDVFTTLEDAQNCIGCEQYDFNKGIERGDFGNDFDEIEIEHPEYIINPKLWDEYIVSKQGYYECWRIEEFTI